MVKKFPTQPVESDMNMMNEMLKKKKSRILVPPRNAIMIQLIKRAAKYENIKEKD